MSSSSNAPQLSWLNRQHPAVKLLLCCIVSVCVSVFLLRVDVASRLISGWDIFCTGLLLFYWLSFFTTTHAHIRKQSAKDDPSRMVIFIVILVCSAVSMLAVILLLTAKNENHAEKLLHIPLALAAMILSWFAVHTIFTARYAHMYYHDKKNDATTYAGGLEFPGNTQPDFLDFAYFSFVLGMTFQVSDVEISSPKIRRLALLHGLISFVYNTVIVALTINIIAGLQD